MLGSHHLALKCWPFLPLVCLVFHLALHSVFAHSNGHPPRIITPPKDQNVISGRMAIFICMAIGSPRPQIEWRKNNKRLTTQRYSVFEIPNGSVLRIEPVKSSRDNATYECLAENGVGEPVRATAMLQVYNEEDVPYGFPSIDLHPTMQGVEKGRNALMACKAIGDPEPSIIWIKDMMPIDLTKPRYSLYQGASLQILNAQEEDQGPYECIAENKIGTAYSEQATLYVKTRIVPPFFSIPPESRREVMPGSDLNLTCVAVGSPMPYVSWRKGNIELNKENIPIGKNVLTLTDIQESENYSCVASSKHGTIETRSEVIVQSLPRPPNRMKASELTPSSLKLSWFYENGPAAENIIYFIVQYRSKGSSSYEEKSSITTTYYSFESLLPYTEYEFRVLAANTIGRGEPSESFYITTGDVNGTTGAGGKKASSHPRNVQVRPLSTTVVVVQWEQPEEPNGQVVGYKVYYTKDASRPITEWDVQSVDSTELTTISELMTNVLYTLRVQAVTTRGMGSFSPPVQVKTQQGVPSQAQNLVATTVTATTVQLTWDKPDNAGEAIIGYDIGWNDTFTNEEFKRSIPEVETYTLGELYPDTLYYIWVTAKSRRGHGASTPAIPVKTLSFAPLAAPRLVHVYVNETLNIVVEWLPPPLRLSGGQIVSYRVSLYEIDHDLDDSSQDDTMRSLVNETIINTTMLVPPYTIVFAHLTRWTQYEVSLTAISVQGEGPSTNVVAIQTDEEVPGEPRDVKVVVLNSTSIGLKWQQPEAKRSPGQEQQQAETSSLIRGYHIHLQEISSLGEPVGEVTKVDVPDGLAEEFNVSGLQPDTDYAVSVAAVTRKGDGAKSTPVNVKTQGGVPNRPTLYVQSIKDEASISSFRLEWRPPNNTAGPLLEYRLRFGRVGSESMGVKDELLMSPSETSKLIEGLERGSRYEFKLAGRNSLGWGQEAIAYIETPEGQPSAPPRNLTHRLQSPTTVVVTWEPPPSTLHNGKLIHYGVQFHKLTDLTPNEHNTTQQRMVFSSLDDNTEYSFRVRAYTSRGSGPWTDRVQIMTPGDAPPAPTSVQAMATSETSVEVWWDVMPFFNDILGYTILYTQIAVEDLDLWWRREVALTWSAELTGLEPKTMYAIRVAAYTNQSLGRLSELITVRTDPTDVPMSLMSSEVTTHSITLSWRAPKKLEPIKYRLTFGAHKEFYDSQGVLQRLAVQPKTLDLQPDTTTYKIQNLMPFTTYQVNVTSIGSDDQYRPPARLIVTTAMAAPKPMVKPDTIESKNKQLITVILPQASEEFGLISHYYLVVVPEEFVKDKEPDSYTIEELSSTPADQLGPYITAKWMRRSIPNTFSLGDGQKYNGFVNRKLAKETRYRIFVRAVVDTPQKSLFTSSPFSDILSLDASNMNFRADEPTPTAGKGQSQDPTSPAASIPRNVPVVRRGDKSGAILILSIVLAILVVVLAIGFYIVKHRRQLIKYSSGLPMGVMGTPGTGNGGDTSMKLLMNPMDGLLTPGGYGPTSMCPRGGGPGDMSLLGALMAPQAGGGLPSDPVELRRLNYQTPAMRDHPPIPITELANHIELLKENDNAKFSQEYESIDPGQQFTWENSNLAVNKPKNRYANVIAYDHSRVVLQPLGGVPGSDYINANYCDGYRKPNAYIATQGPLPETFGDFWRMVWEQASASIVMMTKLEERTRVKCDQYWPSKGCEIYGDIEVALVNYEELATYCIRTFTLKRLEDGGGGYEQVREVRQYQFTAWPDHGVPRHPTPFLMFLRRVRLLNPAEAGALVIHCSAGVGRTGCYIVIDSMLERIKYEDTIDIYGHVTCLRAQRNYTVQTEDQYIFIYDAVLEAVVAGNTEVNARQLYNHVQMLMQIVAGENCTAMELEFKKISAMRVTALGAGAGEENKFISANLPCNKHKNRLMNILPYESTRVYLQPMRNVEGSDYINANFIDGYRHKNAYVATQGPLMETCDDFWRMIWEHNVNIIVSLTQCHEMGREKCYQYWPAERSQRYSCFVVDPITEYNIPQYILREFKITDARDNQTRMIRQFHYVDWPEQGVPKQGESFIEFITQVHKTKEQFGHEGPIVVHCSAGVGRTGVFIALSIILERLQNENVIDLFQTVRTLRTQRPGMVQTEDQYQFCYRAVLEYISSSIEMAG